MIRQELLLIKSPQQLIQITLNLMQTNQTQIYKKGIFSVKEYNDLFETCDYFDVNSFNNSFPSSINNLFVIHLNI